MKNCFSYGNVLQNGVNASIKNSIGVPKRWRKDGGHRSSREGVVATPSNFKSPFWTISARKIWNLLDMLESPGTTDVLRVLVIWYQILDETRFRIWRLLHDVTLFDKIQYQIVSITFPLQVNPSPLQSTRSSHIYKKPFWPKAEDFILFVLFDYVHVLLAFGINTYYGITNRISDFRCQHSQQQQEIPYCNIIFFTRIFAFKLFHVSIAVADSRS